MTTYDDAVHGRPDIQRFCILVPKWRRLPCIAVFRLLAIHIRLRIGVFLRPGSPSYFVPYRFSQTIVYFQKHHWEVDEGFTRLPLANPEARS